MIITHFWIIKLHGMLYNSSYFIYFVVGQDIKTKQGKTTLKDEEFIERVISPKTSLGQGLVPANKQLSLWHG